MSANKTCSGCYTSKPSGDFPKKGGLRCRACCAIYLREYREKNADVLNAKQRAKWAAMTESQAQAERERSKRRHWSDRESQLERARRYYSRNRDAVIARQTAKVRAAAGLSAKNMREWRKRNPEKAKASKVAYYSRMRRAPAWADRGLMSDIYKYARIMREHGVNCHTDHQVPLRGRLVSGLHTHDNLTVILAEQNMRKSAKFEAE